MKYSRKQLKKLEAVVSIILLIAVFVVGYLAVHALSYALPLAAGGWATYMVYGSILIPLVLLIPYLMLKLFFHAEHLQHPEEAELQLKDLPKSDRKL